MDYKTGEKSKSQDREHQVKLKQMDLDAKGKDRGHDLLMRLIESGQATPAAAAPLSAKDADMLMKNYSGPLESSGKIAPPPDGSFASDKYPGGQLPAGYNINPKNEKKDAPMITLTPALKAKAPSLSALPDGHQLSNKDYIDAVELEKTKGKDAADKDMNLAKDIVEKSNGGAQMDASQSTKAILEVEKRIKAHRRGEKVTFPTPSADPVQKSFWEKVQENFKSLSKTVTPEAKPGQKPAAAGAALPGLKITKKKV